MISEKHKCIFVHIQKTAGTSVRRMIKGRKAGHSTAQEYIAKLGYAKFKRYFSFTFVRNPWDRALSIYFQKRQWYHHESYKAAKKVRAATPLLDVQRRDFNDWLVGNEDGSVPIVGGFVLFFRGQAHMLKHRGGICVDFVGRFERLARDWDVVRRRIGVSKPLVRDLGKTKHDKYARYYEPRGIEVVRRMFAEDVETFGYEF